MKRSLLFFLIVGMLGIASVSVEASGPAGPAISSPHLQLREILRQQRRRHNRNRNNGNTNVRYETRIVHKGNKVYRDTYRITWKNGHESVKRVDRVRIR